MGVIGGCGDVVVPDDEKRPPPVQIEPFTQSSIDKIDLLLMLDNSRSMADKQLILAAAIPDLVGALVNPRCVDPDGIPVQTQPASPLEPCAIGAKREITPVTDIHIGIISSSLGGHGSDACSTAETQSCSGSPNPSNNDAGHLLSREDACGGKSIATYQNMGFLAWDPTQQLTPPGEKDIGSIAIDTASGMVSTVTAGVVPTLKDMVLGAGQIGCGYEAQLESWYRFLVDPEPSESIVVQGGKATPTGTDTLLLAQRKSFLRSSSLLAIILLTDENDCSVKEQGQFYYALQQRNPADEKQAFHLPRARAECAKDPNDPCCKSCAQSAAGCPVDAMCVKSPTLSDAEDDINLRCFDQKRRFGVDFLYPTDRYTQALTSPTIPNRAGDLVPNPLFSDLDPGDDDSNVRDPGLVMITGIVGVPWQLIARTDFSGTPDLAQGRDASGRAVGGFKSAAELQMTDDNGYSVWDKILGDPDNHVPPKDAHMIESIGPRPGLPGPMSAPGADPIHGHEYSIPKNDDLQYACVFDLPKPRDCASGLVSCDCQDPANDNPLCDPTTKTTQLRAKSYPGLRQLALLRSVGSQGIVASVCPVQLGDVTRLDYGYRAAVGAIVERLEPVVSGQCLPRVLSPDELGRVDCAVIEARDTKGACSCPASTARTPVRAAHQGMVQSIDAYASAHGTGWDCLCEIAQAGDPEASSTPEELVACLSDPSSTPIVQGGADDGKVADGWCYVDPAKNPGSSAEIVSKCPSDEQRLIRFVGAGSPAGNSTMFVGCWSK